MYAIVDIESTGGISFTDKITEIAIFIHDGEKIVDEFTSLVNPERDIPPFISRLTGITNEMVADAPKFYEIAKQIVEITKGCIFVAHNVGFDYNFLKSEFKALGFNYRRNNLCTIQTSRQLIKGMSSYGLGKLCTELGIKIEGRHRARGDAFATVKVFELLLSKNYESVFEQLLNIDTYSIKHHPNISKETIDNLDEKTGIYYMHDKNGEIIYVGKSKNIRHRVMSHFAAAQTKKGQLLKNEVSDITYEETGSELVALLLESHEIKKNQPKFNSAQKWGKFRYGIYQFFSPEGYITFSVQRLKDFKKEPVARVYAKSHGLNLLEKALKKYRLCQKLCGLYESRKECFNYLVQECNGACVQKEGVEIYNERARIAIKFFLYENENFFIIEPGRHDQEKSVIHVENGTYQGFGFVDITEGFSAPEQLKEVIKPFEDNKDTARIISSFIRKGKYEKLIKY